MLAATLLLAGLSGCSGGSSATGCGPGRREALDPGFLQHVLPGQGIAPRYLTDPPTSGPHQPAPPITGVAAEPISRPVQVGLLEGGKVLVQFTGLTASQRDEVKALAGREVVVAPADRLPGAARVIATAWTWKVTCRGLDVAALRRFAETHVGKGPGNN